MWKTFGGRCLYESPQGIRVFQNLFFRWLQFDSKALQTVLNRYAPQRPVLNYIQYLIMAVKLQPQNCCILGLGGGGAAHALVPFLKEFKLDLIENSNEVIEIAKRFFRIDSLEKLNIIHEDAELFVENCSVSYQHLLIDLYTADSFPAQCNNDKFFANCKKILKPNGILAINLANAKEHHPILKLVQNHFGRAVMITAVPGTANLIIFAQNAVTIEPFLTLLKDNKKVKGLSWAENWGYVLRLK